MRIQRILAINLLITVAVVCLSGAPSRAEIYFDYDGNGATDIAAFHLSTDQFFVNYVGNMGQYGWGESDSMPLVWDYDGDGRTEISIYHIPTNQWFVKGYPGDNLGQYGWGGDESVPVPGDYNGDGLMERAFYHTPSNQWFVEGQAAVDFGWNGAECIPLPGDYDGDGVTDMVVYHIPSNQWFQHGVGSLGQFGWDGPDCIPVPGDYNGDGFTEIAVYHVPTNQWFVKGMGNLGQFGWGGMDSFPIPGDYDGDGVTERGFYRWNTNWWFIEGGSDFVWGWSGSEFMPITSQVAVNNWYRFKLGRFPKALVNGDFESGLVGWEEYSSNGWSLINLAGNLPVSPRGGNWAAWLGGDYDEISTLSQVVTVPFSDPTLRFWYWIASEDECGYDFAGVIINHTDIVDLFDLCSSANTGGWVQRTVELGACAGQLVLLEIRAETDSILNSNLFLDDISLGTGP